MDNRAIGVFDSGLGGLTAVRELKQILPNENVIYFGDTARVPYGSHDIQTIQKFARQDLHFILSNQVKAVIIACGTVSSTSIRMLREMTNVPIIGVIEPSAIQAAEKTKNGKVAVIATKATIASGAYRKAIERINPHVSVFEMACPLLVPLVENGYIDTENRITNLVVSEYAETINAFGADTVILGCTHYPIIKEILAKHIRCGRLIESGKEAALFYQKSGVFVPSDCQMPRETQYFVSGSVEEFEENAHIFLQEKKAMSIRQIEIERY